MRKLAGLVGAVATALLGADAALAVPPLVNGKTSAVHDYTQAIRERVFIPQPGIDQDRNGAMDWITADIIRPNTSDKVPAIIDPTPYATSPTPSGGPSGYSAGCMGRELQCMADSDNDGVNDRWPLWYDNYFVPRGFAYVIGQANGTGYSEHGCPLFFGPGDIAGEKSIVDWLNGRVAGYSAARLDAGQRIAEWHNGSSAMVGHKLDGALANGVAATGVEGLKTVVPINGVSNMYAKDGGVPRLGGSNYVGNFLTMNMTNGPTPPPGVDLPNRRGICMPARQALIAPDNLEFGPGPNGDLNPWWVDRDYTRNVDKVKAAVFIAHGAVAEPPLTTFEVYPWWNGLKANGVPRKLWLSRSGFDDMFDVHRAKWVDVLHRWFDHWLYGVENGIMAEPPVSIEGADTIWREYPDWPLAGARDVDLYLRASADPDAPGTIGSFAGGGMRDTLSFTTAVGEADVQYIQNPAEPRPFRRVFLSAPLTQDVHVSGAPRVDLGASLNAPRTTLGFLLADYGTLTHPTLQSLPSLPTRSCWGATSAGDACATPGAPCTAPAQTVENACYADTDRPIVSYQCCYRMGRGAMDTSNRDSLWWTDAAPAVPGVKYRFRIDTEPQDYVIKAGHRIGLIAHGPDSDYTNAFGGGALPVGVGVTLDTRTSKVTLPVVGGYEALAAAGAFDDPTSTVGGTVPPTLSLALGAPATFGAFTPGVARDYTASTTATIVSSAGDAALTSSDPGHLMNGSIAFPQPLQVSFSKSSWSAPTSHESVTVNFKQTIGAGDALRTGAYSKTLTFTLSTTTP